MKFDSSTIQFCAPPPNFLFPFGRQYGSIGSIKALDQFLGNKCP